jgi:chaperone BCS1
LCFIVEDFDANNDDVLKTLKGGISNFDLPVIENSAESIDVEPTDIKEELRKSRETIHALQKYVVKKDDELTLDCVLNVMDGIIELHGAMVIFTTNHLEKIDPAFTRPGRIDKIVHLGHASVNMIREMVTYKYHVDIHPYDHYFAKMVDYKITPAAVQNVYMNYPTEKIEECLQELVDLCV